MRSMLVSNNNLIVGAGPDAILGLQQNISGRDGT
jgi:hypothetical protein